MNFKQAKLDGLDILKDSTSGIYYTQKEWRTLSTDDVSQNVAGYHGRTVSITYARKRVITLEGVVDRLGNDREEEAVTYLQNLFNLQSDTTELKTRTLYIKDMYDLEWTLGVKVKDPIKFLEYDDNTKGIAWRWQVILESISDPSYKSLNESKVSGIESIYGGAKLGMKLGAKLNSTINYIECTTTGNSATPARFEITALGNISSPLTIRNLTDGTMFALDTSAVPGDVIVIDSEYMTVTKNGTSIKASRLPGSIFPIVSQTTRFSIYDLDGGLPSNDLNVNVFFRNSLLA